MVLGGRITGLLSAQSYQPDVYNEEDQQILSTLANQAGVAIQNGRLFGETERLALELDSAWWSEPPNCVVSSKTLRPYCVFSPSIFEPRP